MKKIVLAIILVFVISRASFAIKLEKLPFLSDFHIGIVNGIGMGLDLGVSGSIPIDAFRLGLEVEQIMSDINYSATINATRFGILLGYTISDTMRLNYHMGNFNFMPSRLIVFQDSSGSTYVLDEAVNYKGQYWAFSLDYRAWDFIFTPKFMVDSIFDKGTVRELDLNIGRSF